MIISKTSLANPSLNFTLSLRLFIITSTSLISHIAKTSSAPNLKSLSLRVKLSFELVFQELNLKAFVKPFL